MRQALLATLDRMSDALRVRHRGTEFVASPGQVVTVGTDPSADVTITHPGVSRIHGRVVYTDGWRYRDEQSTTGSFVDGDRIEDVAIGGPLTVLLGHETEGEPLDLHPESEGSWAPLRATPPLRRIETALWVIAAALVSGVVLAVIALVK